jgi:hypothetical protein
MHIWPCIKYMTWTTCMLHISLVHIKLFMIVDWPYMRHQTYDIFCPRCMHIYPYMEMSFLQMTCLHAGSPSPCTLTGPTPPRLRGHHAHMHTRTHAHLWGPHARTPHPCARTCHIPYMCICICWMCASAMHWWRRVNFCSSTSTLL